MPLKWMFVGAFTLAALSGCASAPPRMVQDLRPEGNAGLRLQDASPDRWIFSTGTDQMTGQRGYSAATWSKTVINLPYPYQGEQRASLMVGVNAGAMFMPWSASLKGKLVVSQAMGATCA